MGIEIIHDHHNGFGIWEMGIHQITHTISPINHSAPLGDFDMPPSVEGCKEHEHVARSVPFVFIVVFGRLPWLCWQWQARFFDLLFATFIKTHHRTSGIIGAMIDFQHIFHRTHKLSILFGWNAPFIFQPGFEFIFFNVVRTGSLP